MNDADWERFCRFVEDVPESTCLRWTGPCFPNRSVPCFEIDWTGPWFGTEKMLQTAAVLAVEHRLGEMIAPGEEVRPLCGNYWCVNGEHWDRAANVPQRKRR